MMAWADAVAFEPFILLLRLYSDGERNRLHDERLALRCQSGDADGFAALVDRFQSPLLYYAAKISGNLETGRDIVRKRGYESPAICVGWRNRRRYTLGFIASY